MSLNKIIEKRRDDVDFLIFMPFLIGFLVARAWRLYPGDIGPALGFGGGKIYTGHHLYYGVAIIIVASWISINYREERLNTISAIFYGAGLGIFFDQIGYIITEFENYHTSLTYYAVVTTSLVLFNLVFFKNFWRSFGSEIKSFVTEKGLDKGPLKLTGLLNFLDKVVEKYPKGRKLINSFIGTALITVGGLVIALPEFINYYVSALFLVTGIAELTSIFR